jgi:hypothetical protein
LPFGGFSFDRASGVTSRTAAKRVAERFLSPKRAMVGNSFDPFELSISRIGPDRYLLEVTAAGSVRGNVQSCSDTLRFVSNDVHELSGLFLTLGLGAHRHRVINKSEPIFRTEGRLVCKCTIDFEMKTPNPEAVFREAQRALGVVELKIAF